MPRNPFPEIDLIEGDRDYRDGLPVGVPLSARGYIDALQREGVELHFKGLVFNLCRLESPQAAVVEFIDDLGQTGELVIWTYQSADALQLDWNFEQPTERRVVPSGIECPTGALLAQRIAGSAWVVENIVVAIPTDAFFGTPNAELLLAVLDSLSALTEPEPQTTPG